MKRAELAGQRFHLLTVIRSVGVGKYGVEWLCRCDCGNEKVLPTGRLKHTKSCGCLVGRYPSKTKHGQAKGRNNPSSRLYETWSRARCSQEGTCDAWEDFAVFKQDMGIRPSDEHVLMRRDPTTPFDPGNCFWATRAEVSANLKTAVTLTHEGKTQTVSQWSEEKGLSKGTIKKRLARGWSVKDALERPPGPFKKLDLADQRFGFLTVIEEAGVNKHSQSMWLCHCDCGNSRVVGVSQLRGGHTRSCGCVQKGQVSEDASKYTNEWLARRLCSRAKTRAKRGGVPFNLDPAALQIPDRCPVLGIEMRMKDRDSTPTLDRLDPAGGYTTDNVSVISWRANSLKKNATLEEVRGLARWMEEQWSRRMNYAGVDINSTKVHTG